jgi:polyisoprenyl-phosphate glycosyltransferase
MAASSGDWVATLDEDGQQDPADIAKLLDHAVEGDVALVYAKPVNGAPHARWRNAVSRLAKRVSVALVGNRSRDVPIRRGWTDHQEDL